MSNTPKMSHAADRFLLDDDAYEFDDISNMIRTSRGYNRAPAFNGSDYLRSSQNIEDGYGDTDFA